jgi:hypothetical protein
MTARHHIANGLPAQRRPFAINGPIRPNLAHRASFVLFGNPRQDSTFRNRSRNAAIHTSGVGRDDEARRHIETARKAGWDAARAERYWRRLFPNSPRLEGDIATVRALYAATEPGA